MGHSLLPLLLAALFCLSSAAFVHPGVVYTSARLRWLKSQLNTEPIKTAYSRMSSSKFGRKTYAPEGPPSSGVIECGSYSNPNFGCSSENDDGAAAIVQLLLFAMTDDTVYANNAVRILNAYGHNLKKYNNSNAPLQAAWGSSKWGRAAELAKHLPGVGWSTADQEQFGRMLTTVVLPLIHDGSKSNGNWELSMLSAMTGISVFLDNSTLFDHAVSFWKERTPAYLYNFEKDGNKPYICPRGHADWYNQSVFNASTSGHSQETCRDEGHTLFGVAECVLAAETALIQGHDLFTLEANRLATAIEYNAKLNVDDRVPEYICGGKVEKTDYPTLEMGYNALARRLSHKMPYTLEYIEKITRTNINPVNAHMMIYETFTHSGNP